MSTFWGFVCLFFFGLLFFCALANAKFPRCTSGRTEEMKSSPVSILHQNCSVCQTSGCVCDEFVSPPSKLCYSVWKERKRRGRKTCPRGVSLKLTLAWYVPNGRRLRPDSPKPIGCPRHLGLVPGCPAGDRRGHFVLLRSTFPSSKFGPFSARLFTLPATSFPNSFFIETFADDCNFQARAHWKFTALTEASLA